MHAALREHFGDIARWTDPEGGFFCWVTLDDVDATALFEPALAEGVAFIPGNGVLPVRPIRQRAAAVLRLHPAGPDPRGHLPAAARRRPAHEGLTGVAVSTAEQAVLDKIDEDQLVELTRSLVRAHGQNPPGEEATTVAALAGGGRRARVSTSARRPCRRVATTCASRLAGGDGPGLLLLGHTDVVPVGEGWTKDPFGGAIHDGRIYGRGATDMKGGLAACLSAMAALAGHRAERARRTRRARRRGGERHRHPRLRLLERMRRSWAVSPPSRPTCRPSSARAATPTRGSQIHGTACHAGNPGDGANAIYGAAAVVAEIERCTRNWPAIHTRCSGPRRGASARYEAAGRQHRARRMRRGRRPAIASGRVADDRARRSACPHRGVAADRTRPDRRGVDADGDARPSRRLRNHRWRAPRSPRSPMRAVLRFRQAAGPRPATAGSSRATSASRWWSSAPVRSPSRRTAPTSRSPSTS